MPARIDSPSLPLQDDELLPEINQSNEHETIIINDHNVEGDIDFTISGTANRIDITKNNDDDKVTFVKQTAQHPRDATMLQNKTLTIEVDADVVQNYPSLTADVNIDETDKNIKHEEVFDKIINQLPPDNDTIHIEHNKKNNKYRVRRETSDKDIIQKLYILEKD